MSSSDNLLKILNAVRRMQDIVPHIVDQFENGYEEIFKCVNTIIIKLLGNGNKVSIIETKTRKNFLNYF